MAFWAALLPFLGKAAAGLGSAALAGGKALGTAALAGGKGLWNLGKFIPQAAGKLMAGVPMGARSYGPGAYGWTSPIVEVAGEGWNLSKFIPQALQLMQGLGGLTGGGTEQQAQQVTSPEQQPYTPQIPQFPAYSTQMPSYGDIISKMLNRQTGFMPPSEEMKRRFPYAMY